MPDASAAPRKAPARALRVVSVWVRHFRVYSRFFVANATPAVFEPVFFLLAVGLGVGRYIDVRFMGLDYASFMAPGILGMTSVYTAAFEATYGTFVRLKYQQTYDVMRATPLTPTDIFTGELLWCGSKGLLFATVVGLVLLAFGKITSPAAVLVPVVGFLAATAFAGLGFLVTSFVSNMSQFQFFFTIVLTPLIFFSGLMFPVQELPGALPWVAYGLPMFHVIESFRLVTHGTGHLSTPWAWACPLVLTLLAATLGWAGVRRMTSRILA
jgi:lipooligosaccharide transport system permease protein